MTLRMLVDGLHKEETRLVIADDDELIEFDIESSFKKQNKGNIYLAKVTRVEPSLQAAFVEYGSGRQGFLPFSEIHPDYYQIPVADKQELMRALSEEREAEAAAIEAELERQAARQKSSGESEVSEIASEAPSYGLNDSGIDKDVIYQDEIAHTEEATELPDGIETSLTEQIMPLPIEHVESEHNHDEHHHEVSEHEENARSAEMKSEGIEELASDDTFEDRPRRAQIRRYKIQEVIKKNQVVLIQVIKEERGNKGASVTTYISLPGRYCVLMPNTNRGGGVSRKISDIKERKKLKETIGGLEIKDGMSIIIRTNGMGRTKTDINRDYSYLIKLWNQIRENTLAASAPALVYEEGNIIKRTLRDFYTNEIEEVLVSGEKALETAREFMKMIMPTHVKKVIAYNDNAPIFNKYGVEKQLISMNDPVVTLDSGGYIVINSTEALITIDVNSGRSTGERNVEDTATKCNIDAAYEIARQLKLRDLAGLIVIDFIDMMDSRHRRSVERALKDALRLDRAKIQVGRITPFGLLEMSRQRLRPSLTEISMIECPTCVGRGIIRSNDSSMVQLARSIENEVAVAKNDSSQIVKVVVTTSTSLGLYFLNNKRKFISELEAQHGFELSVEIDNTLPPAFFSVQLEDDKGNKSRIISSEDRDASKLPQSRGGEKGKRRSRDRRSGGGERSGRDRDRNKKFTLRDGGEQNADGEAGDNVTEVKDENISGEGEGEPRRNPRRRNRNRNRNRNRRGDRPRGEEGQSDAPTQENQSESFAQNEKIERAQTAQDKPVDQGELSQSDYKPKPVKEIVEPIKKAERPKPKPPEDVVPMESSGPKKGWWRR